jgi:hypothetical protein
MGGTNVAGVRLMLALLAATAASTITPAAASGSSDTAWGDAVAIDSQGRIVVAGGISNSYIGGRALARYLA